MALDVKSQLDPKKRYLQIALNSTMAEARSIISQLPLNERVIIEVGTPMIKHYGTRAIANVRAWYAARVLGQPSNSKSIDSKLTLGSLMWELAQNQKTTFGDLAINKESRNQPATGLQPYIVADMKCMDRGLTEVELAANAGANAVVALGSAPPETLNAFVETCENVGVDAMIDMMNVDFPLSVLRQLRKPPPVVILHRGVDEEDFNREKQIPLHEIRRIKSNYNIFVSVAGGDTLREVQRAFFNDADIVVVWRSFYASTGDTAKLAQDFLDEVK